MAKMRRSYENEPLAKRNATKSYAKWLAGEHAEDERKYADYIAGQIKSAKKSATYGSEGEKLTRGGISDDGYGNYLKQISSNALSKAQSDAKNYSYGNYAKAISGYKDYLENQSKKHYAIYEQVLKSINDGQVFSQSDAYEYALRAGLPDELAASAAKEGTAAAIKSGMKEALTYAVKHNLSYSRTKKYALLCGFNEEQAKQIAEQAVGFSKDENDFYSSISAEEYAEIIKNRADKNKDQN